jgi:hypothetical protein
VVRRPGSSWSAIRASPKPQPVSSVLCCYQVFAGRTNDSTEHVAPFVNPSACFISRVRTDQRHIRLHIALGKANSTRSRRRPITHYNSSAPGSLLAWAHVVYQLSPSARANSSLDTTLGTVPLAAASLTLAAGSQHEMLSKSH